MEAETPEQHREDMIYFRSEMDRILDLPLMVRPGPMAKLTVEVDKALAEAKARLLDAITHPKETEDGTEASMEKQ